MSTPSSTCSHCGFHATAADDLSEGTVTCGSCGKEGIRVSDSRASAPRRPARRSWLLIGIIAFVALGGLEVVGGGIFLLGLAVFRAYGPAREQTSIGTAEKQLEAFMAGLETYRLAVGGFPSTSQGLAALRTPPADLAGPHNWAGPYLAEPVAQDPWKRPYGYRYPGKHDDKRPDIWSSGPDGVDGTEDDVAIWRRGDSE